MRLEVNGLGTGYELGKASEGGLDMRLGKASEGGLGMRLEVNGLGMVLVARVSM